jgi:para-aminobenzoate synthetase component 1
MASSQCSEESSPTPVSSPASPSLGRPDFLRRVEEVKRYIRAGDVYQVNLTQRFDATTDATPEALYARLRHFSPSGHAAFLRFDDAAIISSSPELFLHLRDRVVTTRPIKGTRPRTGHPAIDDGRRRELAKSAKDRAELAMIVDLLRNDLGRVCEFGSVRVEHEGAIEMHPTVLHRVATISGRLREDADWCDLLAATFPCGSVTGAPKIRAMQIIDELEPTARGVYCGAIGYVGLDGAAQFNVAIRTMVYQGGAVQLYAGSGIVADSVAEHEYDETLAKARGMMLALNTNLAGGSPLAEAAIA